MNYIIKGETLESIADAIREKTGKSDKMLPTEFAEEINAISGGGGSGEKLTLFTPSISLNSVTSELTITDENGGFVQGYNLYANDELVTVLTSKTATLADYIEHTETLNIKVQAVGANFNPSDYAVVEWKYVNVNGTAGLAYTISSDGTYATCTGLGDATATDIVIGSLYDGVPVTTIGKSAFLNCKTLTSITIPDSITSIEREGFFRCSGVTSFEIPYGVTKIDHYMFYDCQGLKSVVIGGSVTSIGEHAFWSCKNLKRLDLSNNTSVPTLYNTSVFNNCHADLQIKVPANLIDEWKNATNWANYADRIVTEFTNEL